MVAPAAIGGLALDTVAARAGMPGSQSNSANPLERDRVQLLYRDAWRAIEVIIRRSPDVQATTTTISSPIRESTLRAGGFAITVRGALDEPRRAELANRSGHAIRPPRSAGIRSEDDPQRSDQQGQAVTDTGSTARVRCRPLASGGAPTGIASD